MSGQYLEAHAFLKTLRDKGVPYTETLLNLMQYAVIEEVAPVVHAHWIADSRDCEYTCSHCGDVWRGDFDLDPYDDHFYYCPCCGAKMDEEVQDNGEMGKS